MEFLQFWLRKQALSKFIDELQHFVGANISKQSIIEAWNSMLLDLPKERIALLGDLKTKYKTFLLSNTNEIHKIAYCNYLKNNFVVSKVGQNQKTSVNLTLGF